MRGLPGARAYTGQVANEEDVRGLIDGGSEGMSDGFVVKARTFDGRTHGRVVASISARPKEFSEENGNRCGFACE